MSSAQPVDHLIQRSTKRLGALISLLGVLPGALVLASLYTQVNNAEPGGPASRATTAPVTLAEVARGQQLYQKYCVICHGATGEGNGPAAMMLDPRPRNFRLGKFRLITSGNGIAS